MESGSRRQNSIGFLRFALAAFVIYTHAYYLGGFGVEPLDAWTGGNLYLGKIAVQCFFALSGILITESYLRSKSLPAFLWHRTLRLIPAFWVCLFVTAFVFAPLITVVSGSKVPDLFTHEVTPISYFFGNLIHPRAVIGIGNTLSTVPHANDWNGSLWTLFYEGFAYLLVATLGVFGLLKRWRVVGSGLLIGVLTLYVLDWLGCFDVHAQLIGRLFDTPGKVMVVHFLAGALWVLIREKYTFLHSVSAWIAMICCLVLVAGILMNFWSLSSPFLLPPLLMFLSNWLPFSGFESRVGGDYSYGIYVYGYPAQQLMAFFHVTKLGLVPFMVAGFVLAFALAYISWHKIEKPALGLKSWKNQMRRLLRLSDLLANMWRLWVNSACEIEIGSNCKIGRMVVLSTKSGDKGIRIGDGSELGDGGRLETWGGQITLGASVFLGPYSVIYGHGGVNIGDNCLVGMHCRILSSNHTVPPMGTDIRSQPNIQKSTTIGRDVWLGAGVTVLGGVNIGDGCVVGAGAVVAKDLPGGAIAYGVPAVIQGWREGAVPL